MKSDSHELLAPVAPKEKERIIDGRNKVIDTIELSKGSVSASVVDVREIIKEATKKPIFRTLRL